MFGIANLNLIPVRTEPSDKSELSTQLLFGDAYKVLEESEDKKWYKILIAYDDYQGWIDKKQHNDIAKEEYEHYLMHPHEVNFDDVALVEKHGAEFLILIGSTLPFLKGREMKAGNEKFVFQGELFPKDQPVNDELIKFFAFRFLNAPYLWGGKSIFGVDCSGFVQIVFKLCGYHLKRDASEQIQQGEEIDDINQIKTGDLAFFKNNEGSISHVGIIIENNLIIHASGKVRIDQIDQTGILNQDTGQYTHQLYQFKRIVTEN